MNEIPENKPATWFWIVSGLALVWNLLGVMAYVSQVTMSPEAIAKLPEADQAIIAAMPSWYLGAFALAVHAGALGCLALLFRKSCAFWIFSLSFVAVVLQQTYHFVLSDIGNNLDAGPLAMTISIPVIAILLIWMAHSCAKRGWLR